MTLRNMIESIPMEKRIVLSEKLADVILSSKNDDKMPTRLANTMLHYWQRNLLLVEEGLTALLEAATLLEPEKTRAVLTGLNLSSMAEKVKETY